MTKRIGGARMRLFWGCPNYPRCNFTKAWDKFTESININGLSPSDVMRRLLANPTTGLQVIDFFMYAIDKFSNPSDAWLWLTTENPLTGNIQPIKLLIDTGTYEQVLNIVVCMDFASSTKLTRSSSRR
ncbi:hypothetical protein [Chitinimonas taiwanensis]|nr:hypothetical protein [Chitinimonas taiwanensis]